MGLEMSPLISWVDNNAVLGECYICGCLVYLDDPDGHLWKQPDGKYACNSCDVLHRVKLHLVKPLEETRK